MSCMRLKTIQLQFVTSLLILIIPAAVQASLPSKDEIIEVASRVNNYWIDNHESPGDNAWARATYFKGNMALYDVYPDQRFYNYALNWAESHNWELNGGDATRFADNQCAGQTYLRLYEVDPQPYKIEHIKASIDNMVDDTIDDDWWWIDSLFMAMPVFTKLGVMYSDTSYFNKMWDLYRYTKYVRGEKGLYSDNHGTHPNPPGYSFGDHLWWRDAKYDPPATSPNDKQIYWSRGNGWVIAGHVGVLQSLPDTNPHYTEYLETFQAMAASLALRQRGDGFWNPNLDDPDECGGKETSGTAFFTYAIAWGINNGLLNEATFRPLIEAAWDGMVTDAVHLNGKLGFVQAAAAKPCAHYPIGPEDTTHFGVGAFLLAASEVAKTADSSVPRDSHRWHFNNDASDSIGGANGSLQGGAGFTSQAIEGEAALSLPGDGSQMVVTSAALKEPFDHFTVSLWFYANEVGGIRYLFELGGGKNGLAVRLQESTLEAACIAKYGTVASVSGAPIEQGTWHHAVAVFKVGVLRIYLDGNREGEATTGYDQIPFHANPLSIGGRGLKNKNNPFFVGSVDDVRVWQGTALTNNQVASL